MEIKSRTYSRELCLGLQINKLILVERVNPEEKRMSESIWKCKCLCGNETVASAKLLVGGKKGSCGCLRSENHGRLKHGHLKKGREKPEYRIWLSMMGRCKKSPDAKPTHTHKNYFDRGINVCERWRESFDNFYADMGPRPSSNYSIDRINNDCGYSPENCRWATNKEQCNNRRSSRFLTINGETKTLKQWSEKYNIKYCSLQARLKSGWNIEDALEIQINSPAAREEAKQIRIQGDCVLPLPQESHLMGSEKEV